MIALPSPSPAERSSSGALQLERTGVTSHFDSPKESEFWKAQVLWRDTIVAKVSEEGRADLVEKVRLCGTQMFHVTCCECSSSRQVFNHCDRKYCPLCTPRLAHKRRESVEAWVLKVRQPKHVVLTMRNADTLTRSYVRSGQAAVSKLRRSKFASKWLGGFVATELTKESRGWHLHYHALVDARWIDSRELAVTWGKLVGQNFAIVKVKDCREKSYLQEVTKYAVKGSDLASWCGDDIIKFIHAFNGLRTFHPFGSCFKLRAEVAEYHATVKNLRKRQCECGCGTFRVMEHIGTAEQNAARTKAPVQFVTRN